MFKSAQHYRTFLTVLLTYTLDLVGFSIVFPVLAPLLLNPQLHFFAPDILLGERTTILGLLFAIFGIAQFIGAPIAGVLADHYGRHKTFLATVGLSVVGYGIMAFAVYAQSLSLIFVGRIVTGFCSGNVGLAQSATADLTDAKHRGKAFGILLGVGGLGFVVGPWFGGKLANPDWLFGSGAFIFAAVAAMINFITLYFFYVETWKRNAAHAKVSLFGTFKDMRIVFHHKILRTILIASLLFFIGWAFLVIFSPTYLVQRFSLGADKIGDIYAYFAIWWMFVTMYLNKELVAKFSLRHLIAAGAIIASVFLVVFVLAEQMWWYWIIIPILVGGGGFAWVNFGTLLSLKTSDDMQGRAMGVSGSMWSLGQIIAPLVAGPLAGWNMYAPLLLGAIVIFLSFVYFVTQYKEIN